MKISPDIQNASSQDWQLALQSWFSQKENPLWKSVKEYSHWEKNNSAAEVMKNFISSLGHKDTDQILANFYNGLAEFFPQYIRWEARKTNKIWATGNGDLWSITNSILDSKVQVQKILVLQENIQERFTRFEKNCLGRNASLTKELKMKSHTEYIASMIRLALDYRCVNLRAVE